MTETVTMPKLGFDMAEGTLVRWVIQEGEEVKKGAVLAEIETDKATVEVESTYEGVLLKQLVPAGEVVPVNTPIAVVGAPGEKYSGDAGSEKPAESATKGAAADQKAPAPAAVEGSPDAAAMTNAGPSPAAAPAAAQNEAPRPRAGEAPASAQASEPAQDAGGRTKVSPLARRMARDMKINLSAVRGSGPEGRIVKKDIESYLAAPPAAAPAAAQAPAPAASPAAPAAKPAAKAGPALSPLGAFAGEPAPADERVPLNRLRQAIGRRMVESKQQVPHFYVTHEYDMEAVMELRKQINALLPDDQKLSVNDFIVKAVALALRQFPNLNASINGNEIVRHGQVNVGVAVAVEGGLLTVVCRDADRKPLRLISQEVRSMAAKARDGKVRPDDIEGSTFSISNLGMFDVENFIAIINPPEAAILAVGSARETPVVKDGTIVPGWRMKASISVDHRVSDGAEAARFMQALAPYIEQPLTLLV
jgi:pyruvate dehydrogenase E2 component (dihydrolipoamide acetyltransferase)